MDETLYVSRMDAFLNVGFTRCEDARERLWIAA